MTQIVIAGDLGATNLRLGLCDIGGEVVDVAVDATTKQGAEALVVQIASLAGKLLNRAGADWRSVAAVALGVPAVCNRKTGLLDRADNLPELNMFPFANRLEEVLGVPVSLENDVNAAALGEHRIGAATAVDNFIFIAIGTGAGMGIFSEGKLVTGATGAAGEIAYLPIGADPFDPAHRDDGAFTAVASGVGLAASAVRLRHNFPETTASPNPTAAELFSLAQEGDPLGVAILEQAASLTARAVLAAVAVLDPELVVLGGGVGSNPLLLPRAKALVEQAYPYPPTMTRSVLGELAGLYGALGLALDSMAEGSPEGRHNLEFGQNGTQARYPQRGRDGGDMSDGGDYAP